MNGTRTLHRHSPERPVRLALDPSEVIGAQASMSCDPGHHPRPNLFAVVKREHVVCPSCPSQRPMRTTLSLDLPADPQQGCQDYSGLTCSPVAHAATVNTCLNSGALSPCSSRSAKARRTSASTRAIASSRVVPYAMAPGSSATSAIQRPSSSTSVSTFMT